MLVRKTIAALAGLLLIGAVAPPAGADPTVSPDIKVNGDTEEIYTHVTPSLAVDPADADHMVAISVKRPGAGGRYGGCMTHETTDGGDTWTSAPLPVPDGLQCQVRPIPEVTFGQGGAYAVYYASDRTAGSEVPSRNPWASRVETPIGWAVVGGYGASPVGQILVSKLATPLAEGGAWSEPVSPPSTPVRQVFQELGWEPSVLPLFFFDRPRVNFLFLSAEAVPNDIAIEADPASDDVWVAQTGGPKQSLVLVSRSMDGGDSFGEGTPVAPPLTELAQHPNHREIKGVSLASSGSDLHVGMAWRSTFGPYDSLHEGGWGSQLDHAVSNDRGESFSQAQKVAQFPTYKVHGGLPRAPALAVDQANPDRVYMVYEDQTAGDNSEQIFLVRSMDGGATWDDPARIGDDNPLLGFPHERPSIDVAPNGRLDIVWYDGRNSPTSMNTSCPDDPSFELCSGRDVYYTFSEDGGENFAPNVRVTPETFEAKSRRLGEDQEGGNIMGATGLVSTDAEARILWEQSAGEVSIGDSSVTIWDLHFGTVSH